jgi:hypothetical protein
MHTTILLKKISISQQWTQNTPVGYTDQFPVARQTAGSVDDSVSFSDVNKILESEFHEEGVFVNK